MRAAASFSSSVPEVQGLGLRCGDYRRLVWRQGKYFPATPGPQKTWCSPHLGLVRLPSLPVPSSPRWWVARALSSKAATLPIRGPKRHRGGALERQPGSQHPRLESSRSYPVEIARRAAVREQTPIEAFLSEAEACFSVPGGCALPRTSTASPH